MLVLSYFTCKLYSCSYDLQCSISYMTIKLVCNIRVSIVNNTIWRKISKSFFKVNILVHSFNILYKTPKCLTNAAQVSDADHGSINALTCLCAFVLHLILSVRLVVRSIKSDLFIKIRRVGKQCYVYTGSSGIQREILWTMPFTSSAQL